jgi:hypothetical protein
VKTTPWVAPVTALGTGEAPTRARRFSLSVADGTDQSAKLPDTHATNRAFERMLDELQIPSTLRPKLFTLETPLKAAMLKSSHVLKTETPLVPPKFAPQLRKSKSSTSLQSQANHPHPRSTFSEVPSYLQLHDRSATVGVATSLDVSIDSATCVGPGLEGGASASASSLPHYASSSGPLRDVPPVSNSKPGKDQDRDLSPAKFCLLLKSIGSTDLPVEKVKKLRLMLRNESAGCVKATHSCDVS